MVVYTGGTFDLFHAGHVELLYACRQIAGTSGRVIVALNTDEFIEKFKGKPPVMTYNERERVLRACTYVDDVVPNVGGPDSTTTIDAVGGVRFVVIGSDWAPPKDYHAQMGFTHEWLDDRKIVLLYVDRHYPLSSTDIKKRLERA